MREESKIGPGIRKVRKNLGMTLRDLAERTGFSVGYLSKVETSSKAPPVATLLKLSKVLNVSVGALFGETEDAGSITIVRRDERTGVNRGVSQYGYTYETLAPSFVNRRMEPYVLMVPATDKEMPYFHHEGQELMFFLEGKGMLDFGGREYFLDEGDCAYLDATVPHRGRVVECEEMKVLVVVWSP